MIKIGIPTNLRDKRFGTHGNYIEWVAQFGQPILLTPGVNQINQIDALFLPGGKDIIPHNVETEKNVPSFLNNPADPHLEWFDKVYLPKMISLQKPVFGLCRGMQRINDFFGGTTRNLYGEKLKLHQQDKDEDTKNSLVHEITEEYKTASGGTDCKRYKVNSIHHQAIDELGDRLKVLAKCGNVIEAFKHKELPIVGIQWHAEKINDEFSKQLFKSILKT